MNTNLIKAEEMCCMHLIPNGNQKNAADNIIDNPPADCYNLHKLNVQLGHLRISRGRAEEKGQKPKLHVSPRVLRMPRPTHDCFNSLYHPLTALQR